MKKFLVAVALAVFGSAFAGTASVTVNTTVDNVCVFSNNQNANTGSFVAAPITLSNYNAVDGASGGGSVFSVLCNQGANFTYNVPSTVALSNGTDTINGDVSDTSTDTVAGAGAGQFGGDEYFGSISVSVDAGAWDANAGNYSGVVQITVSYN